MWSYIPRRCLRVPSGRFPSASARALVLLGPIGISEEALRNGICFAPIADPLSLGLATRIYQQTRYSALLDSTEG